MPIMLLVCFIYFSSDPQQNHKTSHYKVSLLYCRKYRITSHNQTWIFFIFGYGKWFYISYNTGGTLCNDLFCDSVGDLEEKYMKHTKKHDWHIRKYVSSEILVFGSIMSAGMLSSASTSSAFTFSTTERLYLFWRSDAWCTKLICCCWWWYVAHICTCLSPLFFKKVSVSRQPAFAITLYYYTGRFLASNNSENKCLPPNF